MPPGRSPSDPQNQEPVVEIDNRNMQILVDDGQTAIDYVQEREVVESEHSQDVPEVLAEDDKNPNIPE